MPTCYRHPGRETYIRCQRCDRPICPDCMRSAAVGFQCPHCVAEGARSTRSGRTAYGGPRPTNPQLTSAVLVAVNAVVWVLIAATGGEKSSWLDRLALLVRGRCDPVEQAGYYPGVGEARCQAGGSAVHWVNGVADGAWWQLATSAFTHVEIWHIAVNMLALWILGPQLEAFIGRARYLALYLLSGLGGSACVYWLADQHLQTVGASGALFGLMGALLMVAIKVRGNVQGILMWIGINAVITVVGRGFISWQGHLGGLVTGLIVGAILIFAPKPNRATWQVLGIAAVSVALLGLLVGRTLILA